MTIRFLQIPVSGNPIGMTKPFLKHNLFTHLCPIKLFCFIITRATVLLTIHTVLSLNIISENLSLIATMSTTYPVKVQIYSPKNLFYYPDYP